MPKQTSTERRNYAYLYVLIHKSYKCVWFRLLLSNNKKCQDSKIFFSIWNVHLYIFAEFYGILSIPWHLNFPMKNIYRQTNFFSPKNKANYFTLKYFDGFVFYWKMSRIWCFNMFEVFSSRRKNHKNWFYKHSSK